MVSVIVWLWVWRQRNQMNMKIVWILLFGRYDYRRSIINARIPDWTNGAFIYGPFGNFCGSQQQCVFQEYRFESIWCWNILCFLFFFFHITVKFRYVVALKLIGFKERFNPSRESFNLEVFMLSALVSTHGELLIFPMFDKSFRFEQMKEFFRFIWLGPWKIIRW